MTSREFTLLNIAIEVMGNYRKCCKDPYQKDLPLTGSLMLALRGLKKRREASDIDFLISKLDYENIEDVLGILPSGFEDISGDDIEDSYDPIGRFYNKELDIKIEFLIQDFEDINYVDGIACGTIYDMVCAKIKYSTENNPESALKHRLDIKYLFDNNIIDKNTKQLIIE